MMLFFGAVILVIIGTYCLFTAGSITLLKILKKNKKYYYQTRHFTSVSQMIYRMKQNAVGLASICILCTCILVMLSSTVSLYISIQDSTNMAVNEQLSVTVHSNDHQTLEKEQMNQVAKQIQEDFIKNDIQTTTIIKKRCYLLSGFYKNNEFGPGGYDENSYSQLTAMSLDEFNKSYQTHEKLKENEILVASNFTDLKKIIKIKGQTFHIKKIVDQPYFLKQKHEIIQKSMSFVFASDDILKSVLFSNEYTVIPVYECFSIDFKDIEMTPQALKIVKKHLGENYFIDTNSQYELQNEYFDIFGGLFFLGLFLGILFLMAAILMMYYKQLSEGYEDQKRYLIMQNVGMSQKEVKQSIRSQILIFFFLPILVAMIHMAFAFKMIVKMFSVFVLSKTGLFLVCTIISMIILLIIYSIVYSSTAKVYYKIVSNQKK